ncbi:protein SMAX1-LIKE 3-like [Cucurbita moschata]|uniref:Protein SMAX1-LIKE 3-like n=1 Tax=Cucurbita moschata TaxID=3662 RepID=A0A6J1F6Y2_CUCMO|nr:protein SMAX1-LIKE 3-like [Cucurbita moschata]
MRTGGCTVQQALTSDALSVVKQALILAKRRGHAQVTPLHVATTMLAAPTGLLRTACLQSHSHPLQCKALELCFNVALNRLPASNSSPMLGPQSQHHPSISNALVAAFKRAQAHQRRGSIENQQQPLLAVKIELEQLIISILDDPSVSRVMREAGFSSTQVKSKVEQAVSTETKSNDNDDNDDDDNNNTSVSHVMGAVGMKSTLIEASGRASDDDIATVINDLAEKKKRSVVVVGECVASLEGVVEAAIGRIEKREVPECLKEVKFIKLSISCFRNRSRVEVDEKVMELKSLIRSCLGKGVILYVGDIKWTIDYRANHSSSNQTRVYYCPVEHMIMELGKLAYGNYVGDHHHHNGIVWIMGIATFQTYMRCKSGNPSLETLLPIHPLTIPAGSLRLSLTADSGIQSRCLDEEKQLSCCVECSAKFETEARSLHTSYNTDSTTSSSPLPAWLQQYKNEQKAMEQNEQNCVTVRDLYRKWNSICNSIHKHSNHNNCTEKSLSFSCILPNSSSSTSRFSYDHHHYNNHLNFSSYTHNHKLQDHCHEGNMEPKQFMALSNNNNNNNHGSTPSSTSSGSDIVLEGEYFSRFKELNSENFTSLRDALEKKVPWQKNVVGDIASAVLQCRSGMGRRKGKMGHGGDFKQETWLLFQGNDLGAKEKVAAELARVIFGSATSNLVSITLSSFSSTRADSMEDCRNKRSREEQSCSYIERFAEAVSINPHRVFLIEDVEQADYCSQMGFKRAIEGGRITNSNGQQVPLADAILILSCESFSARSRACSPPIIKASQKQQNEENDQPQDIEQESSPCLGLDLNISIDEDDGAAHQSIDDVGLLDSVDRRIIFQIQQL